MQDLVPCILVSFDKEQIIVWRGKEDGSLQDQTQKSSDQSSGVSSSDEVPDDKPVISNPDPSRVI